MFLYKQIFIMRINFQDRLETFTFPGGKWENGHQLANANWLSLILLLIQFILSCLFVSIVAIQFEFAKCWVRKRVVDGHAD